MGNRLQEFFNRRGELRQAWENELVTIERQVREVVDIESIRRDNHLQPNPIHLEFDIQFPKTEHVLYVRHGIPPRHVEKSGEEEWASDFVVSPYAPVYVYELGLHLTVSSQKKFPGTPVPEKEMFTGDAFEDSGNAFIREARILESGDYPGLEIEIFLHDLQEQVAREKSKEINIKCRFSAQAKELFIRQHKTGSVQWGQYDQDPIESPSDLVGFDGKSLFIQEDRGILRVTSTSYYSDLKHPVYTP